MLALMVHHIKWRMRNKKAIRKQAIFSNNTSRLTENVNHQKASNLPCFTLVPIMNIAPGATTFRKN